MRFVTRLLAPLTLLAVVATGCGPAEVTVEITGNDQMQFSKKEFTVPAGAPVKLVFKNVGEMPKTAMGHNLVILNSGVKAMEFGPKVPANGGSMENDHLPDALKGDVMKATKILGPGESETLRFTAPAAGTYEYVCTFPGHFAAMNGKMIVQ